MGKVCSEEAPNSRGPPPRAPEEDGVSLGSVVGCGGVGWGGEGWGGVVRGGVGCGGVGW